MKKWLIIFSIIVLLISPIVILAAEAPADSTALGLRQRSNEALEGEVKIPESLQLLTRVLFGIKEEKPVTFQELVILIATFFIFFFIIKSIVSLVPLFETTAKSIFVGLIVTALIGTSGGLLLFVSFMVGLGSFFGLIKDFEVLTLIISIILLLIAGLFIANLLDKIKSKGQVAQAEAEGFQAGVGLGLGKLAGKIAGIFKR